MKSPPILIPLALALALSPPAAARQAGSVETNGQHGVVKGEHLVARHLAELNGRCKLRVTEVACDPGGSIGAHHHAGPGIRCVTPGERTCLRPDRTTVYHPGGCLFESGVVSPTAWKRTGEPGVLLNLELLPADWTGSPAIPAPH